MLADFFTKPLQGSLFRKFRSVLLGEAHTGSLSVLLPQSTNEERVISKRDPSIEVSTAKTDKTGTAVVEDTCYAVTPNKGSIDIVSVDVNTSHSIEKYPEVITI